MFIVQIYILNKTVTKLFYFDEIFFSIPEPCKLPEKQWANMLFSQL